MKTDLLEYIIEKLTELLIEQEFKDRAKGKTTYVKKTRCYKDLVKLLKDMKQEV